MLLERRSSELRKTAAERLGHSQQHIAGMAGIEHRFHHRLQQPGNTGPGAQVVPALERVTVGEQEVAGFAGLVEEEPGGHLERHLRQLLGEAVALRQRVHRIGVVHQQQPYLAAIHGRHQALHPGKAVASGLARSRQHRASYIAGRAVEDRHRHRERERVLALRRDAACDREPRARRGKLARHRGDPLGRHSAGPSSSLRGPLANQRGVGPAAAARDHVGHRECHGGLGPGRSREEFIRIEASEVAAGPHLHVAGGLSGPAMGVGVADLLLGRAVPRLEKVAESENETGCGKVVAGDNISVVHQPARHAHRLEVERFPAGDGAAGGGDPVVKQVGECSARWSGEHRDPAARLPDFLGHTRDRVVPGQFLPGAVLLQHRPLHTGRIVQPLKSGLTAGAQLSPVDRVGGIALELDGPAFAGLHMDAATGAALGAGARIPGGNTGDLIFRLHQVRHQLLHPVGGTSRQRHGTTPGDTEDGEEFPAIDWLRRHMAHGSGLSSGTPCNPASPCVRCDS